MSEPTDDTPTREDFLAILKRLFGSRHPDFEALDEMVREYVERIREEAGSEFAEEVFENHRAPMEIAHTAYHEWDGLSGEQRRRVMEAMQEYEDATDRTVHAHEYIAATN
jgi:hypothetical protein